MDDRLATCWFQPLTQLNIWLRRKDLNPRPSGYEPDELPSCYHPAIYKMVASTGIEPVLQEFSVLCSTYWAMRPYNTNEKWWAEQDSNLQCILCHGFTARLLHQFAYLPKNFGTDNRNRTHMPKALPSENSMSTNFTTRALKWLGRLDSNQNMQESKSCALPFGYIPMWKRPAEMDKPFAMWLSLPV